ncbi:putative ribonuclease H-like domain-containing protein [Tanacetum coccineum]
MIAATKLPMLNPGEFEIWKIRIEQYFLMTYYALWEVIVNGDSPLPKRTVDVVEQTYPLITVEEKVARKIKLKARGTLLMALSNEHQLKFNTYKCTKTLMEVIEKRFGGNKESKKTQKTLLKQQYENFNGSSFEGLDQTYDRLQKLIYSYLDLEEQTDLDTLSMEDLYNNLKIYETEVKLSSSSNQNSQNVAFVSSYNSGGSNQAYGSNSTNTDSECYNCHKKGHFTRECRDPRKNRNREPIRRHVTVETIETKDLVAQDGLGYDWRDQAEEGPTNFALMAYTSSGSSKDIKILNLDIKLRDNALTELRKKFKKAKKERDDLKLTLEKFGNSSKNLSNLLEIQVSDKFKTGVRFDSQVVDSQVFYSQENDRYKTSEGYHAVPPPYIGNFMPPKSNLVLADEEEHIFSESITSVPAVVTSEVKTSESKTKFVSEPLIEDWISNSEDENKTEFKESVKKVENNKQAKYLRKNSQGPKVSNHLIKDCDLYEKKMVEKTVWNNARRGNITTVGLKAIVSDNKGNEANAVKASACWVWRSKQKVLDHGNPHLELQEKGVIDSGCSRHMTGNKSYLLDYEEIDSGFVVFGGDPKGGRITGKGKISTVKLDFEDVYFVKELKFNLFNVSQMCDKKHNVLFTDTECVVLSPDFKLLDENHVLLRVPRKDNMYSVDLKNIVPSGGLTCLFEKATVDESNLWHRRLGHINFKTMNKLVRGNLKRGRKHALSFMRPFGCPVTILNTLDHLGKFDGKADEGFFVGYSTNSKAFRVFNSRTRIVEENLHVRFIVAGNQTNGNAGTKENIDAGQSWKKIAPDQEYILLPLLTSDPSLSNSSKDSLDAGFKLSKEEEKMDSEHPENEDSEVPNTEEPRVNQEQDANVNNTNNINIVSPTVNAADIENNAIDENIVYRCIDDPNMPNLEEIVYSNDDEEVGAEVDMNNLTTTMHVSPILTIRVHKDHPLEQIIGDIHSAPQTRRMTKNVTEHVEPKKTLVDLPYGKRAIGTKWVYRNKKDDRVAKIEAIRHFLAYASFMNFIVYQIDVKSAYLYGIIEEEVYVCQPLGFEDPEFPNKVYKVEKALYGLHQTPKACQDKYVADILKKFDFATVKTVSTPTETNKELLKDEEAADVDDHLYRSMIGSLIYLTASRPDIMFAVCAYARDSPFDLEAFYDSDYAGASLDRKSTTGGCQFLGRRLISWQCKKKTIVANSTTEVEYVAAANYYGHALWIQNQLLDYGYNFMKTKIFIDNETIICIVKNLVFHSMTKHRCLEWNGTTAKDEFQVSDVRVTYYWQVYLMQLVAFNTVVKIKNVKPIKQKWVKGQEIPLNPNTHPQLSHYLILNQSLFHHYLNPKKTQKPTKAKRTTEISQSSGPIPLVIDETIIKEWEDRMERATTTTSSLEAEQDSVLRLQLGMNLVALWHLLSSVLLQTKNFTFPNKQVEGMSKHKGIYVTPFHTKKIFANMKREGKGFSGRITPLFQTMMVQAPKDMEPIPDKATNEEPVSTPSCDPPQSGEKRLQLTELMSLCTKLHKQVLDLEEAKTAQANEIASLKKRVKQLEKRKKSRTSGLKRLRKVGSASRVESCNDVSLGAQEDASKQGRKIADLDADAELTLIDENQERYDDKMLFDVQDDLQGEEVVAEKKLLKRKLTLIEIKAAKTKAVTTAAITITTAIASTRPKAKGIVFQDQEEQASVFTPMVSSSQSLQLPQAKDKGKGKMVEPEKPLKKKDQIALDEELELRLHAEEQAELERM